MLLDHFHPPLQRHRHWHSFHNHWAGNLATDLNRRLPSEWFAEENVQFGIEIDVATFEESMAGVGTSDEGAAHPWTPPEPLKTIDFPLTTDVVEIRVFSEAGGPTLAGAIELVSPANKDRPESREAFVSKCETYLREVIGLAVVDIVTEYEASLHETLLQRLRNKTDEMESVPLYAAAYRPAEREEHTVLDIWHEPLHVGGLLPQMPLYLKNGPCMQIDLASTYRQTCEELRILPPSTS